MSGRIRFHLDEHIPNAIAEGLRRRGIDVSMSVERSLVGVADEVQLSEASRDSRVLVTNDCDFLALHDAGREHNGIAYCHQRSRTIRENLRALILLWEVLSAEDMRNHVEYL